MKYALAIALALTVLTTPSAHAQNSRTPSFNDLFENFHQIVEEEWGRFELSIETGNELRNVFLQVSAEPGLEHMEFSTMLGERELEDFIDELFATPYLIPHFCYALKGFTSPDPSMEAQMQAALSCRQKARALLLPLLSGKYMVRTFKLHGSTSAYDYYKAKIMAEDQKNKRSVIVNFDVVLD